VKTRTGLPKANAFDHGSKVCLARMEMDAHNAQSSEAHGFAFAARGTQDGAVVVRVSKNSPRVWTLEEYGRFETWTQAQVFAGQLNRAFGIDPVEARYIVISASLAASAAAKPRH
jgi:hypothetical protein